MQKRLKEYGINAIAVVISSIVFLAIINFDLINGYMQSVIAFAMINIIVAISLNIATGYLGQLALGHAGFMAIGAYSAALLAKAIDYPKFVELIICLIFGGLVSGIFGLIIGIPALRLRGDYLGIVTLGFGEIIRLTIINLPNLTGGATGLLGIPKLVDINTIYIVLVMVVTFVFLFIRSRHGRAIISIRENEIAAESIGIPTTFYKVYGFFVSAVIAGIGGACFAFYQQYLNEKTFRFMFSVELFIIVVFGGMGSVTGTIIAGIFLSVLREFLYAYNELRLIIYSILLILLMIFKPEGMLGRHEFSLVKTPERIKLIPSMIKNSALYKQFFDRKKSEGGV